ncbi:M23 family metallopeptidase [Domibacillus indicus]|uniref:M23 family metallopeptidase n=1 Tax=Domibacillus indicus TaxID=1437523 RepID=UPI0020400315|nr:M23 family metallopeptidase [Domibacillus indicus]MCM3787392.1 M23 family metallopeptidase [Domibacillus indicus]
MSKWSRLPMACLILYFLSAMPVSAEQRVTEERAAYYEKMERQTLLPWYYLAAVDQFERNIQVVRDDLPDRTGTISIHFPRSTWAGRLNPLKKTTTPAVISFFGGRGLDGDQDGKADPNDPDDVLFTMATLLTKNGYLESDIKKALKDYYKKDASVKQIMTIAALYRHFDTIELDGHTFPLPLGYNYSYRSTWGDKRGWGGRRMHEGTDLFASYGVPVRATTYGIIEIKGWNEYGGWRVGIRDVHNVYHYFAHLSGFEKGIKEGMIVKPGTVVGYVGSSGYGKPGTAGKFPPHLHYGMYKYNGRMEWAFDPYPSLSHWEQAEKAEKKSN